MMYAKGSGIWYNLGETISYDEHSQAYSRFNDGTTGLNGNEELCVNGAKAGFDSIQFVAHKDPVQYPCDAKHTHGKGPPYLNIEIVCLSCVGTYPCMGEHGAPSSVRRGWKGPHDSEPKSECTCDNKADRLNCKGVGALFVV